MARITPTWSMPGVSSHVRSTSVFISSFQLATPGDFDVDGDVDGRDFLFWQRGDSPNNGSFADLVAWRVNFGLAQANQSGLAAPEPCTALYFEGAYTALLFARRRQAKRSSRGRGHR